MAEPERYPYVKADPAGPDSWLSPYLPIHLSTQDGTDSLLALVDSGALVNVLPFDVGIRLGAIWERQTISVPLAGNLVGIEARALMVTASVGAFTPVRLAFAWSRSPSVPVILGQINFFSEFDVCFFRSQSAFEVRPK